VESKRAFFDTPAAQDILHPACPRQHHARLAVFVNCRLSTVQTLLMNRHSASLMQLRVFSSHQGQAGFQDRQNYQNKRGWDRIVF